MTDVFHLSIVTPEKVFYEGDIKSLVIPGSEGYLGVLPNHAPLITALKPGKIEFRDREDEQHVLAVSGGFLEVSRNQVNLLVIWVERKLHWLVILAWRRAICLVKGLILRQMLTITWPTLQDS